MSKNYHSKVLVPGEGSGVVLVLPEPLSLWGGLDPYTGEIIDRRHPSSGKNLAGKVLLMPAGRGSSSASNILLEAVKTGHAPAAIILKEPDAILALGAVVARELYGKALPVVVLLPEEYEALAARDGAWLRVDENGWITA